MVSIHTNNNVYYNQNIKNVYSKNEGNATNTSTYLSDDELRLAKQYKEYLNDCDLFKRALEDRSNGDELHDFMPLNKLNAHRYDDVLDKLGIGRIKPGDKLYIDIADIPKYDLPKQNYSFNSDNNSINFGIGSKISLGDHYLTIFDNEVGSYPSNYKPNPQDAIDGIRIVSVAGSESYGNDANALECLINGVISGNANWGNDKDMNNNILSFLNKTGIDTSKDFKINGVTFETVDGIVQTKGYTEPKQEPSGYSYLNALMAKAYEQHLL